MKSVLLRPWRYLVTVAALAAVYTAMGQMALLVPSAVMNVTPFYPSAGIAQAALLLLGMRVWPGVVVGSFLVALWIGLPLPVAIGMAAIATLQAILGVILLRRCQIDLNLERQQDVLGFITLCAIVSTAIGATFSVSLLCLYGIQPASNFASVWWTWWLGEGMGVLIVTPVFLTWCTGNQARHSDWPKIMPKRQKYMDAGILLILLIAVTWIVFTSHSGSGIINYPLEYLPFSLLVWVALRFAQRGTTLAIFIFYTIAIWGAGQGNGPFLKYAQNPSDAVLYLQAFVSTIGTTAMLLAASVAERQAAERSLRQSKASLAEAQRIAHLGSWNFDLIQQQWYWSDQLYRILGFDHREFKPDRQIFLGSVHPEERNSIEELFEDTLKRQKSYSVNFRILRPNGEERIVREQAETIFSESGIPIRIVGTVQDITKQKRIEQALITSESELLELAQNLDNKVRQRTEELQYKNQELAESIKTIQETQQQLIQSEKMSSLGQLVAGIAHEINNPVNFIYGNICHARDYANTLFELIDICDRECEGANNKIKEYMDLVEFDFLKTDLPRLLTSMQMGAERIHQIVISLRNFSRLDEAQMKLVNIHEGIESTLLLLQQRLKGCYGSAGISVVKEYGDLPIVECYPGELNQVFMNLLTNAIDAIELRLETETQPGIITIQTQLLKSNRLLIIITDNGVGMTQEVQDRVFDPFFTTKPVGKGTGLGLSISYKIIVEHHKGMMKCKSEPGEGTEFHLEIPLRQSC